MGLFVLALEHAIQFNNYVAVLLKHPKHVQDFEEILLSIAQ